MDNLVISIGGSILSVYDEDISFLEKLVSLIETTSKKYKIYLVVGGGKTARKYINIGRKLGLDEQKLDSLGIDITRVNAKLLISLLESSNTEVSFTTDQAREIDRPIVVMGGTTPGHSTDMVGAELAEKTNASKYILATNVDGIYDKDPNKFDDAKKLKEVTIDDLIKKYGTKWDVAGANLVVDGPALKIIKRAHIPTVVVNGKRLDQLEKAISNQDFDGTTIKI